MAGYSIVSKRVTVKAGGVRRTRVMITMLVPLNMMSTTAQSVMLSIVSLILSILFVLYVSLAVFGLRSTTISSMTAHPAMEMNDMSVEAMREYLINSYGPTIRGRAVKSMHESQVIAIYNSLISRPPRPKPDLAEKFEQLSFLGDFKC